MSPQRLPRRSLWVFLAFCAVWYAPFSFPEVDAKDRRKHIEYARQLDDGEPMRWPHFGYQALTIAVKRLLPWTSWQTAGGLALYLAYLATGAALFWLFHPPWKEDEAPRSAALAVAAFLPLVVHPLPLTYAIDAHAYHGFLAANAYHNPTTLCLRPLALAVFGCVLAWAAAAPRPWSVLLAGVAMACANVTKPNFAFCFLPALLVFALIRRRRGQPLPEIPILLSLVAPTLVILAAQRALLLGGEVGATTGIVWAPFKVLLRETPSVALILFKGLLSVAFPLFVGVRAALRRRWSDPLVLSGLTFLFALFFSYFVAESGRRMFHGNFVWTGQIGAFLFFVCAVSDFFRERASGRPDWTDGVGFLLLGLHVLSGLVWAGLNLAGVATKVW